MFTKCLACAQYVLCVPAYAHPISNARESQPLSSSVVKVSSSGSTDILKLRSLQAPGGCLPGFGCGIG